MDENTTSLIEPDALRRDKGNHTRSSKYREISRCTNGLRRLVTRQESRGEETRSFAAIPASLCEQGGGAAARAANQSLSSTRTDGKGTRPCSTPFSADRKISCNRQVLFKAFIAACVQIACRSAPAYPTVWLAISDRNAPETGLGQFLVCSDRIADLSSNVGSGKYISRSNLPGLLRAGSIASGRFVAPITITEPLDFKPSSNESKVATTELCVWSCCLDLQGAKPSISSKNMIEG